MQDELKKVDILVKKQFFYAALESLQKMEEKIFNEQANPEEPLCDELQSHLLQVYERFANIYSDINQSQIAIKYLVKIIKLEQENAKLESKGNQSILRLANSFAKMGKCCFHLSYYNLTQKYLEGASEILSSHNLTKSAEYAAAMVQMGNYYRFMFQDDKAENCIRESISIRESLFGRKSVEVADSLHGLAQLFSDQNKIDPALNSIDEAIEIWEETLGSDHIKTAKSIYLKGNLYLRLKITAENQEMAEKYINKSLQINLKVMGERFQETADCYHSLGKIKSNNTESNEYIHYFKRSFKILKDIYGKSHASNAILLNNFGRALQERKLFDEAVQCFEKSIKIYYQICGDVHGNLAITLKNCADCHKELKRYRQAKIDYEKSLKIYEVSFETIRQQLELNQSAASQLTKHLHEIESQQLED